MKQILLFFSLLFIPIVSFSQEIKGKVVDESGEPLIGVTIQALQSQKYASTDFDGNFSIQAQQGENLKFTMVGFGDLTVSASSDMNVVMKVAINELDDVVVIGYGRAKKRDLTGSIVSVKSEDIADRPNNNVLSSLQGKVAGLSVVNSGQPGAEPDIRIRGTVSLFNTKPLYVIDGIFNDNMSFINPNDVESIEILKDPSSLAVFGAKGANGVIIVTTKKAKLGKTTVNYNSNIGFKNITNKPSLTNGEQFRMLYDQQRINQGVSPYPYYNLYNANTDWIDEIENENAVVNIQNISISNSTEKNKFYLGIGYTTDEGLIKNELYKKLTFNLNDELTFNDRVKVGIGLNGLDTRLPQLRNFVSAINSTPIVSPFNEGVGLYNQLPTDLGGAQLGNPLLEVEGKKNTQLARDTRFVGNIFGEFRIVDNLKLRAAYLADLGFSNGRGYSPVFNVYAAETDQVTLYGGNALTSVNQYKNESQKLQQELMLSYDKSFGKHNFSALAGYTRFEEYFSSLSGTVQQKLPEYNDDGIDVNQIPNDPRWWYVNVFPFGDPTKRLSNSSQWDRSTASYLARLLYNFDGKYLLNGTFRRDGSSEIRTKQNFWSVGAAWEVTKENFMSNQKIVDFLKIKGSVGQLGNQFTSVNYPTYPNYTTGASAVFGESLVPAYVLAFINNPNLKWETITSKEIGFELESLNNRLSMEVNLYDKTTTDLLTYVVLGSQRFYANAGEISNKGLEIMASWNDKINDDFSYSVSGNLTTIKNKVNSVYNEGFEIFENPTRLSAGSPISSFYGYEVEGVYQTNADILLSPTSLLGSYGVGDLKFKDINGDGVITPEDRTNIGNPTPDFTYGISTTLNYKNLSLSAEVQGVYGNEIYRNWGNGSTFTQFNYRTDRLGAWNGPGTSNFEPRLNDASGYNVNNISTYMIEDGSYARLRNIQLTYSFNPNFLSKMNIESLRVYLSAQNLVTWSNNSGFSPEAGGSPTRFGVDTGGYPVPSITSLGLNVTF